MRARLHDSQGPAWSRAVLPAIGLTAVVLTLRTLEHEGPPLRYGFFVGLAILLLSPLLLGRARPTRVRLDVRPGRVRIRGGGVLNRTLRARGIVAASTARSGEGVSLALTPRGRTSPLLLELDSDEDARTICRALGIGYDGFGALRWERCPRLGDRAEKAARVTAAASLVGVGLLAPEIGSWPSLPALMAVLVPVICSLRYLDPTKPPSLELDSAGVSLRSPGGMRFVPYAEIASVDAIDAGSDRRAIRIVVRCGEDAPEPIFVPVSPQSHLRGGMTEAEVVHAVEQIRSAAQRARGLGLARVDVTERLGMLRRGADDARAWLGRLDALAVRLRAGVGGGYRDINVDEDDLWSALEDHDAPTELRAAAARVLVRVSTEARIRVDTVVDAVRDVDAAKRIRVAVETDDDEAAIELEEVGTMAR